MSTAPNGACAAMSWTKACDAEIVSVSSHLPEKIKLTEFFVSHFLCNFYIKPTGTITMIVSAVCKKEHSRFII
jgi:hypothetical protein